MNKISMETAYANVNTIKKEELKNKEHQKVMSSALTDLWSYKGFFPNENKQLQDARFSMESPEHGEAGELSEHFKQLYKDLEGLNPWEIIFTMYNKMKDLISVETDTDKESSDKLNKEKEKNMTGTEKLSDLDELEKEMNSQGVDSLLNTKSNVREENTEATKEQKAASVRNMADTRAARVTVSQNAVIDKVVIARPPAVNVCVSGMNAKGVLSNPDKALEDFRRKTGLSEDDNGAPIFKNIPNTDVAIEAATQMYNAIKAAQVDPTKEFEVHFSKSLGAVKGFLWSQENTITPVTDNEMKEILITKACGFLTFPDKNLQVQVKKANARNRTAAEKGIGTDKREEQKGRKDSLSGIVTIGFTDRAAVFKDYRLYHKDIIENEKEIRGGLKTEMSCVYWKDKVDGEADRKQGTFRLPLKVEQYKLAVTNPDLLYFGTGEGGVGAKLAPIDVSNAEAISAKLKDLAEIAALAAEAGVGSEGSIFDDIRKQAATMEAEEMQKEAADVGMVTL